MARHSALFSKAGCIWLRPRSNSAQTNQRSRGRPVKYASSLLLAAALLAAPAMAQTARSAPMPIAAAPAVPAPRDIAYPGVITLNIDTTDLDRRIWRIKQTIPVSHSGDLTLLYSEWIMGN